MKRNRTKQFEEARDAQFGKPDKKRGAGDLDRGSSKLADLTLEELNPGSIEDTDQETLDTLRAIDEAQIVEAEANVAPPEVPVTESKIAPSAVRVNPGIPREVKIPEAEKVSRQVVDQVDATVAPEVKEQVVASQGVNPDSKKKGGISSQFKNALIHLAPQALGMLVGGLIEGTDGAVAGGEAGRLANKDLHDFAQQDQQLDTARQNADTQRQFAENQRIKGNKEVASKKTLSKNWVDSSGNPVFTDTSGTFTNIKGEPVTDVKKQEKDVSTFEAARIENFGNIEKNREFRREQANEADAQRTLKDLRGTVEYKTAIKAKTEVPLIRTLLDDAINNGGQSLSMLGPKIAKGIAGEVGVLTEQDVVRYVQNPDAVGKIRDKVAKVLGGKLSPDSGVNIRRLLDLAEANANNRIKEATEREATLFSRRSGLSQAEAMNLIDSTASVSNPASTSSPGQNGPSRAQSLFNKYKGQ